MLSPPDAGQTPAALHHAFGAKISLLSMRGPRLHEDVPVKLT